MKRLIVAIIIAFSSISMLTQIGVAENQPYRNAYFTSIKVTHGCSSKELINGGVAKVYNGQCPLYVNLTFHNADCTMIRDIFSFHAQISTNYSYALGDSSSICVDEGADGQFVFDLCNCKMGIGIKEYSVWNVTILAGRPLVIKVRLYYFGYNDPYQTQGLWLEDERNFTIVAVTDFLSFSSNPCNVEKGKTGTLWLSISNLDDDYISDVNIEVIDSNIFEISPNSRELGDIVESGKKTATFNVSVPDTANIRSYNVELRITYTDFSGATHVETKKALITVGESELFPNIILYLTVVFVLVGIGVLVFLVLKRKKSLNGLSTNN